MFMIVMFYINPLIDSQNGLSVISLQLAFDKNIGIEVIKNWRESGINNFNQWIFTDYIYAFSYSLFFASLLSFLICKKKKTKNISYAVSVYLAFIAGFLDCIENTMELSFINAPETYSSFLFFIHSCIASIKWALLPIIVSYIIILLLQNDKKANKAFKQGLT